MIQEILMTRVSEDIYSISFNITSYYGISSGEEVRQLAFVFRSVDGEPTGRTSDGGDIFLEVYPQTDEILMNVIGDYFEGTVQEGDSLALFVQTNQVVELLIADNGDTLFLNGSDLANFSYTAEGPGLHKVLVQANTLNDTLEQEFTYFVSSGQNMGINPPEGQQFGVNYLDSTYLFMLYAPGKDNVFLLTPENDFSLAEGFAMNVSLNGDTFWIELPRTIFENGKNTYQYLVDGVLKVADPYAPFVLDPDHDSFVRSSHFQGLPPYPTTASGRLSGFDLDPPVFDWEAEPIQKPAKENLVIYELLIRDFLADHSYSSLIDSLSYLKSLGINAIELMPINEFEGNISWGYNPSFHLAVDKYYGRRDQLKRFVDEAHKLGISVILDVVFNHAFGQSPFARLYWDTQNNRPAADNPWLNTTPRHPFNVGYDFNHESQATKSWVKRNLEQWVEEYRFDGFRFDLSKGLTQTFSGEDAGLMSQYDPRRITILKEYADYIWSLDPDSYVIMEHFADNREEIELAQHGMMLWGNMNFQFAEAAMGYVSDLDGANYLSRGWPVPHLLAYMESHDEERIMYKLLQFGNSNGSYNTKDLSTALDRVEAISALYYSIPGPKMLWQFGELGYEFSINTCQNGTVAENCRLDLKPIRWDYLEVPGRLDLLEKTSQIIKLRTQNPTFSTRNFQLNDTDPYVKQLQLSHPDMNAFVITNFDVVERQVSALFPGSGIWYDFFSGDSLELSSNSQSLTLAPGAYHIYTSKRVADEGELITSVNNDIDSHSLSVYPNPLEKGKKLYLSLSSDFQVKDLSLLSLAGKSMEVPFRLLGDAVEITLPKSLSEGMYLLRLFSDRGISYHKIILRDYVQDKK